MKAPTIETGSRISSRFVTVLGKGSNTDAWKLIQKELEKANLFFTTNIEEISAGSISSLTESDVLTNLANPLCVGLILFQSDAYFRHLETRGGAEKPIVYDHLQRRAPTFSVVSTGLSHPQAAFEFNRVTFRPEHTAPFVRNFRAWLQDQSFYPSTESDFHPEIIDILSTSFSADIVSESGDVNIKADDVRYSIYRYSDGIMGTTNFVLYLAPGVNLSKTKAHIEKNYKFIMTGGTLLVIIDPKTDVNRNSLLTRVRSAIVCNNSMFLDDFLQRKFNLSSIISNGNAEKEQNIIPPRLRLAGDPNWIKNPYRHLADSALRDAGGVPITLIRGQGGVGKTTLLRQLAHDMARPQSEAGELIILTAAQIIHQLAQAPDLGGSLTLFSLLRACVGAHNLPIGEKQFAWIFDMGRISIAIDGIDEIIPRLSGPQVIRDFFQSVMTYSSHLRRGRLFLTCRTAEFITPDVIEGQYEEYELHPFEKSQIKDYIDARFPGKDNLKTRARDFISDLSPGQNPREIDEILPFILRVVCDSVEDGDDRAEFPVPSSASNILLTKRRMDYVLFKVCEREEAKYSYSKKLAGRSINSIDLQCGFFVELATRYSGSCSLPNMILYLESIDSNIDDQVVTCLLQHPLLEYKHDVTFKDDTTEELFLAIGFAVALSDINRPLYLHNMGDFADKAQLGSPFLLDVVSRVDGDLLGYRVKLAELVEQIKAEYKPRGWGACILQTCISAAARWASVGPERRKGPLAGRREQHTL